MVGLAKDKEVDFLRVQDGKISPMETLDPDPIVKGRDHQLL